MLRIEDTDQERYVEGAVEIIYRTLQETGLVHDEGPDKDGGYGPYVQSERMKTGIYMKYAKELIEKGELARRRLRQILLPASRLSSVRIFRMRERQPSTTNFTEISPWRTQNWTI